MVVVYLGDTYNLRSLEAFLVTMVFLVQYTMKILLFSIINIMMKLKKLN